MSEGGKVCLQPPINEDCTNLVIPVEKFRTIGIRIEQATPTDKPEVVLLTPSYYDVADCVLPLYANVWDNRLPFYVGDCLQFIPPTPLAPFKEMYISVHGPDCADCSQYVIPVTGEESRTCTGTPLEKCLARRECHWSEAQGVGCMDPALLQIAHSNPVTCPFLAEDICTKEFPHICRVENGRCVAFVESNEITDSNQRSDLGVWTADSLNSETLEFVTVASGGGIPSINATFENGHGCDAFGTSDRRFGVQFRGWELMRLDDQPECTLFDRTANIRWQAWLRPLVEHEIDAEGDEQGGFSGQRFLVTPALESPPLAPNELVVAISVGTNGVSVYGFNQATQTARALLVWEHPVRWNLVSVVQFPPELRLYVDQVLVAVHNMPPDSVYHFCTQDIGWSPYGSFVGLVNVLALTHIQDGPSPGGVILTSLNFASCTVRLAPFTVTARGVFQSPPATIKDSSQGANLQDVDLGNATITFSLPEAPPGVFINETTGHMYGIFNQPGVVGIVIAATTTDESCRPVSELVEVTVLPPVQIRLDLSKFDTDVTSGASFNSGPPTTVTGGDGNYRFSYTNLPEGLYYHSTTGVVSGVASESGFFPSLLTVRDSHGGQDSVGVAFLIHPALALSGQPVFVTQGAYVERLPSTFFGGLPPLRFRLQRDGLEVASLFGLSIDSKTGVLKGTPSASRRQRREMTDTLSIIVEDSQGSRAAEQISLTLAHPLEIETLQTKLAFGVDGTASFDANRMIRASGGREPYSYFLESGTSSLNLQLPSSTFNLVAQSGRHTVVIGVRDSNGAEQRSAPVEFVVPKASTSGDDSLSGGETAGIVMSALIIAAIIIAILVLHFRKKKRAPHNFEIEKTRFEAHFSGEMSDPKELDFKTIEIFERIGKGGFGVIDKAYYRPDARHKYVVAVKRLISHSKAEDRDELLHEAALMAQVNHPHIVPLIGVVTTTYPEMLIVPFMPNGSLLEYLEKSVGIARLSHEARMLVAKDICSGMEFLEAHKLVHRDLAARNVLVDVSKRCVIADFGRARHLTDSEYYASRHSILPVRWMPPEALLHQIYSLKTDIFSFGVTLMEVWRDGRRPWDDVEKNTDVAELVIGGARMKRPSNMNRQIYELVQDCWRESETQRPTFAALAQRLLVL